MNNHEHRQHLLLILCSGILLISGTADSGLYPDTAILSVYTEHGTR